MSALGTYVRGVLQAAVTPTIQGLPICRSLALLSTHFTGWMDGRGDLFFSRRFDDVEALYHGFKGMPYVIAPLTGDRKPYTAHRKGFIAPFFFVASSFCLFGDYGSFRPIGS